MSHGAANNTTVESSIRAAVGAANRPAEQRSNATAFGPALKAANGPAFIRSDGAAH